MNVLKFIGNNWHDVLIIIFLISVAIGATISGIIYWIKRQSPIFITMSSTEKIAYITRLLKNLMPIALRLVTDAEIQFGGGTGRLKRSYVIDELYVRIPDEYKKFITEGNLDEIINKVLEEARLLWERNESAKKIMTKSDTPEILLKGFNLPE